jgi:hypothetical protein
MLGRARMWPRMFVAVITLLVTAPTFCENIDHNSKQKNRLRRLSVVLLWLGFCKWLRGRDLNPRPLGYETCATMVRVLLIVRKSVGASHHYPRQRESDYHGKRCCSQRHQPDKYLGRHQFGASLQECHKLRCELERIQCLSGKTYDHGQRAR